MVLGHSSCLLASRLTHYMAQQTHTYIPQAPNAWEILVGPTRTHTYNAPTSHYPLPIPYYADTTMISPVLAWVLSLPASDAFLHVHPPASALTCSSSARFTAYRKEVPPLALFSSRVSSSSNSSSSSSSTSPSSSSLLPLDPTTPALYTGMSRHGGGMGTNILRAQVHDSLCICP